MDSNVKRILLVGGSVGLGLGLICVGYYHFYRRNSRTTPYRGAVVTSLHIYPVKSCAGIDVSSVEIEKFGPVLDRNWMLATPKGVLLSQRAAPRMALIQPSLEEENYLTLTAPGMPTLKLKLDMEYDEEAKGIVNIHGGDHEGLYCGDEISKWFDNFLGKTGLKLYYGRSNLLKKCDLSMDPIWGDKAKKGDEVIFPDTSPVMLLSEASLASLNKHIEKSVIMKAFRPSIVVTGCGPYEEDSWETIYIGDVLLRRYRQCTRCVLTTVDPETGTMRPDKEPLKTLKRVRLPADRDKRCEDNPLFGVHFVVDHVGTINVGDAVIVLK